MDINQALNEEAAPGTERFLVFSLGKEEYSVPLPRVKEVIGMPEITPVPFTPPHFLGIMNLRGQVISVIDLRLKLKVGPAEKSRETAVVILDVAPLRLGVVVSSVNCVSTFARDKIQNRPDVETTPGCDASFIDGVVQKDKSLIILLNVTKALSPADLALMAGAG